MLLAIILISYFMIVLDNSIIFTGLPHIRSQLGLSDAGLSWVQDAYTLVFGGLLLLGARMGDLLGRRTVFIAGLILFGLASLLVGLSTSGPMIIAARAFQGVGAAIVAPTSLALVTAFFPAGPERAKATAAYGTTAGLGASVGLLVGGALASFASWRVGFFINVPIAAAMVALALRYVPAQAGERGRFDLPGAVLSTLGMGAIVFGIINTESGGWLAAGALVPIALGAVAIGVFVYNEWKATQPIMPLRLFDSPVRAGAAVARLLFAGSMIGFFFFSTQLFQDYLGWTPLQAALGFVPMTLLQFLFSPRVTRLAARVGMAPLIAAGLLFVLAGLGWLAFASGGASYLADVLGPMLFIGIGQGIAFGPLTNVGVHGAASEDAGAASGMVNTAHQLGSTLGIAVLTAASVRTDTMIEGFQAVYAGAAVMVGIALAAVVFVVAPALRGRG